MTTQLSEIKIVRFLMATWAIQAMIITFFASGSVTQYLTGTIMLDKLLTTLFIDGIGITLCICLFGYMFTIVKELEQEK